MKPVLIVIKIIIFLTMIGCKNLQEMKNQSSSSLNVKAFDDVTNTAQDEKKSKQKHDKPSKDLALYPKDEHTEVSYVTDLKSSDYEPKVDYINQNASGQFAPIRGRLYEINRHLNNSSIQSKRNNELYVVRHNPKNRPIATFTIHDSVAQEDLSSIQAAFDLINKVALQEGLISTNQKFIHLDQEKKPNDPAKFDSKMIVAKTMNAQPFDFQNIVLGKCAYKVNAETGEIVDADIFYDPSAFKSIAENRLKLGFNARIVSTQMFIKKVSTFLHEIYHCIGISHNQLGDLYQSIMYPFDQNIQSVQDLLQSKSLNSQGEPLALHERTDIDRVVLHYPYNTNLDENQKFFSFHVKLDG